MSSSQIFRAPVPNVLLFDLLEQICLKTDKYYFIDMNAYKKMQFHQLHHPFCKSLIEYYHVSKRFYIERKFTYNSFTNLVFTSQIKYNESKYNIDYFVYFPIESSK